MRPAKIQISLGIRPVWSESSLCAQWVTKQPRFLHADSEDSDQTGRMPRLIWVFAGRTNHFVGFVMRRLISFLKICSGNALVVAGLSQYTFKNVALSMLFLVFSLNLAFSDNNYCCCCRFVSMNCLLCSLSVVFIICLSAFSVEQIRNVFGDN